MADGLNWTSPKADRLQTTTGAMSTKYVVQELIEQVRNQRKFLAQKFYARIAVRLAAVPAKHASNILPSIRSRSTATQMARPQQKKMAVIVEM